MNDKEKINEVMDLIGEFQATELYGSNDRTNTITMRNMLEKIKKILEADEDDGWVPGVVGERTDGKGNKY